MSKTNYLEVEFLKWCTAQVSALNGTAPTLYLALYTTAPTESSAGTEVSGSSYARQPIAGVFPAPTSGDPSTVSNTSAVTFPAVTSASYAVVGVALVDASSGGNVLRYQAITSQTFNVGDQANFPAGSITFTED